MALPSGGTRAPRRRRTCLVLAALLLLFGLLQLGLGVLFALRPGGQECSPRQVRHMLVGVHLLVAGVCGLANYCGARSGRGFRSRSLTALVVVFCGLVSAVVVLDGGGPAISSCREDEDQVFAVLGLVEVTGLHLAHLLSALCLGLAFPDLWSPKSGTSEKRSSTGSTKKAFHLPEARTHVQEAAGTGETVTVVSLPKTDGIIYAVPEDQYVIRRGEATYMAPTGNANLTAFFPTYRVSDGLV